MHVRIIIERAIVLRYLTAILMNAPEHETMEELAEIALVLDKQRWNFNRDLEERMQSSIHGSIGEHSSSSTKPNNSK